jgi:Gluconate 2-dehydrogenase subunit 3
MEDKDKQKIQGPSAGEGELTRRKWLIEVGKAAALAGIAGSLPEASAASESKPETLPAGLFVPAPDHLSHALLEDSRFHPIPPGCPMEFIRPRSGPFEPQFFSRKEYPVIHRLTALMLGEPSEVSKGSQQNSGEALVDEVAEWVDLRTYSFAGVREAAGRLTPEQLAVAEAYNGAPLVHRVKTTDPPATYRKGLSWIEQESRRRHERDFVDLTEEQQTAILDLISDVPSNRNIENDGTRFFRLLKGDIISGFYTSKIGLKELNYQGNSFHAESPGCPSTGRP